MIPAGFGLISEQLKCRAFKVDVEQWTLGVQAVPSEHFANVNIYSGSTVNNGDHLRSILDIICGLEIISGTVQLFYNRTNTTERKWIRATIEKKKQRFCY